MPGAAIPSHYHPGTQIGVVVQGELTYTVFTGAVSLFRAAGGAPETVSPGQTVVVGPGDGPMVVLLLVYNALTAFTSYDLIYAMTGGGPGTATTLLSFQIWKESFSMYDFGTGSAVAFIMVAVSVAMILAISKAMPSDLFGKD